MPISFGSWTVLVYDYREPGARMSEDQRSLWATHLRGRETVGGWPVLEADPPLPGMIEEVYGDPETMRDPETGLIVVYLADVPPLDLNESARGDDVVDPSLAVCRDSPCIASLIRATVAADRENMALVCKALRDRLGTGRDDRGHPSDEAGLKEYLVKNCDGA